MVIRSINCLTQEHIFDVETMLNTCWRLVGAANIETPRVAKFTFVTMQRNIISTENNPLQSQTTYNNVRKRTNEFNIHYHPEIVCYHKMLYHQSPNSNNLTCSHILVSHKSGENYKYNAVQNVLITYIYIIQVMFFYITVTSFCMVSIKDRKRKIDRYRMGKYSLQISFQVVFYSIRVQCRYSCMYVSTNHDNHTIITQKFIFYTFVNYNSHIYTFVNFVYLCLNLK